MARGGVRAGQERRTRSVINYWRAGVDIDGIARRMGTSAEQVARTLRKAGVLETDKLETRLERSQHDQD
jgi:hypothetical protein